MGWFKGNDPEPDLGTIDNPSDEALRRLQETIERQQREDQQRQQQDRKG